MCRHGALEIDGAQLDRLMRSIFAEPPQHVGKISASGNRPWLDAKRLLVQHDGFAYVLFSCFKHGECDQRLRSIGNRFVGLPKVGCCF